MMVVVQRCMGKEVIDLVLAVLKEDPQIVNLRHDKRKCNILHHV